MSSKKRIRDDDEDSPVQKMKSKTIEKRTKSESNEPKLHDLGKLKKVSVTEFKGQLLVNFREYFVDKASGEERPGSKGIALNRSQWEAFKKVIPELDAVFENEEV